MAADPFYYDPAVDAEELIRKGLPNRSQKENVPGDIAHDLKKRAVN